NIHPGGNHVMSASPAGTMTDLTRDARFGRAPAPGPEHQVPITATVPVPLSPLIGREREAGIIGGLLGQPGNRLLTLIGPGGVGKTRLALHVAAQQREAQPDRPVAFVTLAWITDVHLVLPTI